MKNTLITKTVLLFTFVFFAAMQDSAAQDDIRCNCVLYSRQHVRTLPYGLHTTEDKHKIINSMFPRPGTVAIFSYNHVAVVRNVETRYDGSLLVSIDESNVPTCQYGSRRGKLSDLQIVGFFDPRFSPGNTPPRVRTGTTINGSARSQINASISGEGFDPHSVQLVLLGGDYCTTWGRCTVPTSVISNRTTTSLTGPLTINSPGRYSLYVFNSRDGRSSNAIPVTIAEAPPSRTPARPQF